MIHPLLISEYENIITLLKPAIGQLNNKSILITGATGLIGSYLTDFLIYLNNTYNTNINISATSSTKQKLNKRFGSATKNLQFIEHNFENPLPKIGNFDFVIHAASPAHPGAYREHPVNVMKTNLVGTISLLENQIGNEGRFLLLSSGEVYGNSDTQKFFIETDTGRINITDSRSCYPESKRAAETLCASYAQQYGIKTSAVRLCHTYGPTINPDNTRADAQFLRDALNGETIVLNSNGKHTRSWCYVADSVAGILHILLSKDFGAVYNIANPESVVSIAEYAKTLAKIAHVDVQINYEDTSKPMYLVLDATKLIRQGWHPLYDLETGLTHTLKIKKNIN